MNRIERISAILIQLQSKKVIRAQDIAKRFSISLRTAYRDIRALEATGVPITGEAGVGYSLVEGYRLPPVTFTKDEALSFLTAEKLVEKLTDSSSYKLYQSALFKIKSVLKTEDKLHLATMDEHIEVLQNPRLPNDKKTSDFIQIILNSISSKRVLWMDYFAHHNQQHSERHIEPIGIFLNGSQWHMIAYCWLRQDYRDFRIDRMRRCSVTDKNHVKTHPSLKTYLKEITQQKKELQKIVISIDKNIVKYFGDQKFYNGFISETEINGQIEMTFLTSSPEGFARWYMMFGDQAEIIHPKSLKTRVRAISKGILKNIK